MSIDTDNMQALVEAPSLEEAKDYRRMTKHILKQLVVASDNLQTAKDALDLVAAGKNSLRDLGDVTSADKMDDAVVQLYAMIKEVYAARKHTRLTHNKVHGKGNLGEALDMDSLRKQAGIKPPTKRQLASNKLRDMFQSQQYKAKVPVKDIEYVLKSPEWAKIYGKANVKAAWKSLIDNDYVAKKGGHWVWTLGYMH